MRQEPLDNTFGLEIVLDELSGSSLVEDYHRGKRKIIDFYGGDWNKLNTYEDLSAKIDKRFGKPEREKAFETLRLPEGFPGERRSSWINDRGLVVTTGQQPGLFGGPLYTLYKALSAIKLAETLEKKLGKTVIPVFWIASEDHDWEEVRHAYMVSHKERIVDIALDSKVSRGRAIHRVPLEESISEHISVLAESVGTTEFSESYLELLRKTYRSGSDLGTAMGDLILNLLGPKGLVVLDSSDDMLKSLSKDRLMEELAQAEINEANIKTWNQSLSESGYHLQVPILDRAVNLFLESHIGRERIYRRDGAFQLNKSEQKLSFEDVGKLVENDNSILSPNVLLRPIIEASTLPVVSYVAGPGELAYYAQIKPLYDSHQIDMPVIYPRHSATLIEKKIARKLGTLGLTVTDCEGESQELFSSIAQQELSGSTSRALDRWREGISSLSKDVLSGVSDFDPTLEASVLKCRNIPIYLDFF